MNLLFICSRNKWRSPTAEKLFNGQQFHAKSAGTASGARIKLSQKLIVWADIVFVMEKRHHDIIKERFPESIISKKMIVLNIPDDYQYMEEDLIEILESNVRPFGRLMKLGKWSSIDAFSPALLFRPGRVDRVAQTESRRPDIKKTLPFPEVFFSVILFKDQFAPTDLRMMFSAEPALNQSICCEL